MGREIKSQVKTLEEYRAAWLEAERELMVRGYPLEQVAVLAEVWPSAWPPERHHPRAVSAK